MERLLLALSVALVVASCAARPPLFVQVPYSCNDGGYGRCSLIKGDTLSRY